jgi:hypothetical protein
MSYAEFVAGDLAPSSIAITLDSSTLTWSGAGESVEPLEFGERERVDLLNHASPTLLDYRYRLRAVEAYSGSGGGPRDILEILPVPTEDLWGTAYYLPTLTLTEVSGDVSYQGVKGIAEEWLILDVLLTVKGKTDEASTFWRERKAEVEAQLRQQASDRDAAQPSQIRKVWHRTDAGTLRADGRYHHRGYPWRGR